MSLSENRWVSVWTYLSLERVEPFARELWLNFDLATRGPALRDQLAPFVLGGSLLQSEGLIHQRISSWWRQSYGESACRDIREWQSLVFVKQGADRSAEMIWTSLIEYLVNDRARLPTLAVQPLSMLRDMLSENERLVENRLREAGAALVSDWDLRATKARSMSAEDADNQTALIASANSFVSAWQVSCSGFSESELVELHGAGRRIAGEVGWRSEEIPFPGNWIFEYSNWVGS